MTSSTRSTQTGSTGATAPRKLRCDASANRVRLLDAARTVFAERGLDAGVEEIAQVAGVGIGTLYRRFPTKDALITELVQVLLRHVLELAHEAEQVPGGRGLEQFVYGMGEAQTAHRGCLARLWTDDSSTKTVRAECRASIAVLVADAKAHDVIRSDATATDVDLLLWSVRGIIEATGDVSSTAWRRLAAIALAGLSPSTEPLREAPVAEALVTRAREHTRHSPGSG